MSNNQLTNKNAGLKIFNILLFLLFTFSIVINSKIAFSQTNYPVLDASKAIINTNNFKSSGYVRFEIPYHYDAPGANNCWLEGEDNTKRLVVKYDGTETTIVKFDNGDNNQVSHYTLPYPRIQYGYIEFGFLKKESDISWMYVNWYFDRLLFGKNLTFHYYTSIEQHNDGKGQFTSNFNFYGAGVTPTSITNLNGVYKFDDLNKIKVTFNTQGVLAPYVSYKFDNDNEVSDNSGSFYKIYDRASSESTAQILLTQSYIHNYKLLTYINVFEGWEYVDYQYIASESLGKAIQIKGYQAIQDFEADYDPGGSVNLTWNLESGTGVRIGGDQFVIQRCTNSQFTNPVEIGRVPVAIDQTTPFSLDDDLVDDFINKTPLYYRITRSHTLDTLNWGWNFGSTTSVQTDLVHTKITSAEAILNNKGVQLKWDHNGVDKIWSAGSRFVILKENLTTGVVEEIPGISQSNLDEKLYIDNAIQSCNKYRYQVYVLPGNQNFKLEKVFTEPIMFNETGKIISNSASKGYFSKYIDLSWETDGILIDNFSVENRVDASGKGFNQIAQIPGTKGATKYQFKDEQANPGVIYEYRVVGLIQCGDTTIKTESQKTYGFRTPTGDIYGRVTFENGQAEENVEVRIETEEIIKGKSLKFESGEPAIVANSKGMNNYITVQAWVNPSNWNTTGSIFRIPGRVDVGIDEKKLYLRSNVHELRSAVLSDSICLSGKFVHITGVLSADTMWLYVNGKLLCSKKTDSGFSGNLLNAEIGRNFIGFIDEVRIWQRVLSDREIARDYKRYLTGGEKDLLAYYTFNYATNAEFYDCSYQNNVFNENHGYLNGAKLDGEKIPTEDQLGYKGVTKEDGSYAIRAIPYKGNGTTYTIIPRLGIHKFEPQQEIRFIGEGSQSFTVNFIDKSSFKVTGTITYAGGTFPVEGVSFTIDGKTALGKTGNVLMTNSKGEFEISVPVGQHEVIAKKNGHVFENGGKITNSYGLDLNYQDEVLGLKLTDITKVKYIGRVAGGPVQDAYVLGHSLSKNNLADGVTVTLSIKNPAYKIANRDTTLVFEHFIPSYKTGSDWPKTNEVEYSQETITIYPNNQTGEFIAEVIPESFTVRVNVPGHDDIPGSGQDISLAQKLDPEKSENSYTVTEKKDGKEVKISYNDIVIYNFAQKFIKRYAPTVRITQVDAESGESLPYFGSEKTIVNSLDGTMHMLPFYNMEKKQYVINFPVFLQGKSYRLKAEIFEKYFYYNNDGRIKLTVLPDEIATKDAKVNYINNAAIPEHAIVSINADTSGVAYYGFTTGEPELTSAIRKISATISYGNEANATTIPWDKPFDAIVLGYKQTGVNFVTAGPDKVLTILRDPPGSNSYSYLEKGVSFSESTSYSYAFKNEGEDNTQFFIEDETVCILGGPAGGKIVKPFESGHETKFSVVHEEAWSGEDSKTTKTTFTTRFQTSDNPAFVGADADVYIGFSTNLNFGKTINLTVVSQEQYGNGEGYLIYDKITPLESEWYLVQKTGIGVGQKVNTLFAFPQIHIEEVLIPEIENIRNSFLIPKDLYTEQQLLKIADERDSILYVSKLEVSDPFYGSNNDDNCHVNKSECNLTDGPSYKIIVPKNYSKNWSDTIFFLNQSINNWKERIMDNERSKVQAVPFQNYSFHGGSNIEYSEAYSTERMHENTFETVVGFSIDFDITFKIFGKGTKISMSEKFSLSNSKTDNNTTEATHLKGFLLQDEGNDYISVDVCHEKNWSDAAEEYQTDDIGNTSLKDIKLNLDFKNVKDINDMYDTKKIKVNIGIDEEKNWVPIDKVYHSSFIFKTKAGATSCPYEGAYVARYFEPEKHHVINEATMKIEVPEIAVEDDFIENIPMGGVANFKLYLRNNSEIKQDNVFNLKIVDNSNPDGAKLIIDGAPIGNGREFMVPAGQTLVKTLEVGKGAALNYDNLKVVLQSQCEESISDTLIFSVHFIPSCSDVGIKKPTDKWTYNTKMPVLQIDGVDKHYTEVRLAGFDVNYDSFNRIKLQYKSSAESDDGWKTLMNYYADYTLYQKALKDGMNAEFIKPENTGQIIYKLKLDDLPDQKYDLRAVSVCMINNEEIENYSEISSGIKDMYNPRLFGSPQPANGILTIKDEIRLNFNEQIAEGLLTKNNFQVTGIRNGAKTDHSVSLQFDGINDYLETEFDKNLSDKDLTIEMWVKSNQSQDATLFSHGSSNEALEIGLTANNYLKLRIGNTTISSKSAVPFEAGSWSHIAIVYNKEGMVTGYYNFEKVIFDETVNKYKGVGNFVVGKNISTNSSFFQGQMHNLRVWDKKLTSGEIQVSSLQQMSGYEPGLFACYPMDRARGEIAEDISRGANLLIHGCNWTVPEGRAMSFNGTNSYLQMNSGSAVVKKNMDFTIEFWFKGEPGQKNATLLSNGRGDNLEYNGSANLFALEINAKGILSFKNNGLEHEISGNCLDNNWHHIAVNASRTYRRAHVFLDGELVTFFDSEEIGGIASAYLFAGARGWYGTEDPYKLKIDNYFKGMIDEIRIWNLYKYEQQIQESNNIKLDGTEMGLLTYYPFEYYKVWQGRKELDVSLSDLKFRKENSVEPAKKINCDFVQDIPPVKDKGPVSELEYDFVVNNDALIITLKEAPQKIEKTIITFTIDGVRDMNGNENVSPITWSAYIDRNMLKWENPKLAVFKALDKSTTFSNQVLNLSGSVQYFKIDNMPSWLDVYPKSGTINPSSKTDITFKIAEGLNVGKYNEAIYLTNTDNVSECFDIEIVSKGKEPEWKVNPGDFVYSSSLFATFKINNLYSKDPDDKIAAFANGKCIGIANVEYEKRNDSWVVLMTLYSNEIKVENIVFKIWDASTGITYLASSDKKVDFINNNIVGSLASPQLFETKEQLVQNIDLKPRWNWISFNLQTADMNNLNTLLSSATWTENDLFEDVSGNRSASYSKNENEWKFDNIKLQNSSMYKITTSANQELSITGMKIIPSSVEIPIKGNQWNYIGYLPNVRLLVDEALDGYSASDGDVIKSQNEFALYTKNLGWNGNLKYMEPGKGYMLKRNGESNSFKYPDYSGTLSIKSAEVHTNNDFVETIYSGNMNLVAKANIFGEHNDRILAYSGGKLFSQTTIRNGALDDLFFITIPVQVPEPLHFLYERNGEVIGRSQIFNEFHVNSIYGSVREPFVINFLNNQDFVQLYPNPVHDILNVSILTSKTGNVHIAMTDMSGKKVMQHLDKLSTTGILNKALNCSNLTPGLYIIHVAIEGENHFLKFEKQ